MQVYEETLATDKDGKVTFTPDEEGVKVNASFTASDSDKQVKVGEIEVMACTEPGLYILIVVH